jgi:hypothetical protein
MPLLNLKRERRRNNPTSISFQFHFRVVLEAAPGLPGKIGITNELCKKRKYTKQVARSAKTGPGFKNILFVFFVYSPRTAATPGSVFPSRYSRSAPPAVEM